MVGKDGNRNNSNDNRVDALPSKGQRWAGENQQLSLQPPHFCVLTRICFQLYKKGLPFPVNPSRKCPHAPTQSLLLIADFHYKVQHSRLVCGRLSTSLPGADWPGQVMLFQFLPPSDWNECGSSIQLILPDLFKWKNLWHPSHIAEDLFGPLSLLFSCFSAYSRPFCNV